MRDEYAPMFADPVGPWFRWFAWRPVYTADRGFRWLRFVWRRKCQMHAYLHHHALDEFWQHAVARSTERKTSTTPTE